MDRIAKIRKILVEECKYLNEREIERITHRFMLLIKSELLEIEEKSGI